VKTYRVNEIFYSLQGEGVRAGTPNLFLRFAGCNETCSIESHGFDCDTEFASGRALTLDQILAELKEAGSGTPTGEAGSARPAGEAGSAGPAGEAGSAGPAGEAGSARPTWIVLTGGEPALQVDGELIDGLRSAGYKLAIETNGSIALPEGIDWITVSPKVAEHAIRQRVAHEVKYVRNYGQGIPRTVVQAQHKLISPAFSGDRLDPKTLEWCIQLVKENPDWRLSIQMHKSWRVR
jgi:organic radical activating enzyme